MSQYLSVGAVATAAPPKRHLILFFATSSKAL